MAAHINNLNAVEGCDSNLEETFSNFK